MKALVTGSAGFIGSHLVGLLEGHEVVGMDARDGIDLVTDCPDLVDWSPDVVFHLASLIDVAESFSLPGLYMDNNLTSTLNILEAVRECSAKLVYISSSEVYGTARYTPQDEKHPLQPQSPYAASKIACEALVESYHHSYGVDAVILRPFNTYGPRQQSKAVISHIMQQARDRDEIELGNLESKRDFTYVTDTARAMLLAAELPFGVYNCGSGKNISIGELVGRITDKPIRFDPDRKRTNDAEVWELKCDATKFREATGWEPEVSLDEGLKRTREWFFS